MALTDRQTRAIEKEAKRLGISSDELLRRIVDMHFLDATTRRRTAERLLELEKRVGYLEPQLRAVTARLRAVEIEGGAGDG